MKEELSPSRDLTTKQEKEKVERDRDYCVLLRYPVEGQMEARL